MCMIVEQLQGHIVKEIKIKVFYEVFSSSVLYGKMNSRTRHSDFCILLAHGSIRGVDHHAAPMVT